MKPLRRNSSAPSKPHGPRVGLARALSKLGLCSRSIAFAFIRSGKVRLNGATTRNPEAPVRLGKDRIELEGKPIQPARKIYLLMNKPRGLVTTASDEKGRDTVYSLLPADLTWLAPVGRLDKASEGLLLFTNDSAWAARITDPASHLDKTYHVQINAIPGAKLLASLEQGVLTKSGETFGVKRVHLLRSGEKNSWLEVILDEGKNRQIRRMLEALDIEILQLIRIAIGPLLLGDRPKGCTRPLTDVEIRLLSAK